MDYFVLRQLHVTAVVLSGAGFFLRGLWMLNDSPMLGWRWVRVLPHLIDSVLLASAVSLAAISAQYPLVQNWLTAKVLGLLLYIGLGTMALRRGKTKAFRAACLVAALLTFLYIISVAVARHPLGVFADHASALVSDFLQLAGWQ